MGRLVAILSSLIVLGASLGGLAASASASASGPATHAVATPAAGSFRPVGAVRVLDTRTGAGLATARTLRFAVGGRGAIPADAVAVSVNITVLTPARSGSVSVSPGDTAWNGSASISFLAGRPSRA
jgi:hypothetical protein